MLERVYFGQDRPSKAFLGISALFADPKIRGDQKRSEAVSNATKIVRRWNKA
jgi:hypothetical protein